MEEAEAEYRLPLCTAGESDEKRSASQLQRNSQAIFPQVQPQMPPESHGDLDAADNLARAQQPATAGLEVPGKNRRRWRGEAEVEMPKQH
jgi:hypothetical protein